MKKLKKFQKQRNYYWFFYEPFHGLKIQAIQETQAVQFLLLL